MTPPDDDTSGFLYAWERTVLAARISSTTKLVAFAMRTFADADGSRVRPTIARLCVLCALSYASVRRARQELLRGGLLELARRGNRRKGQADEYRLILAEDILDRLTWLTPSEIDLAAEEINEQRQAAEAARRRRRPKVQDSRTTPEPEPDQESPAAPEPRIRVHTRPESGVVSEPPPTQVHHPTTATNPEVGNATHHTRGARTERPRVVVNDSSPADDADLQPATEETRQAARSLFLHHRGVGRTAAGVRAKAEEREQLTPEQENERRQLLLAELEAASPEIAMEVIARAP